MPFTVTSSGANAAAGQAVTLTLTIPANSIVGVSCSSNATSVGTHGTCVDSNSNAYSYGSLFIANNQLVETFYTLNSGPSATTLTYTQASGQSYFGGTIIAAWILTATGAISVGGSGAGLFSANAPTTTNGITTGNLSITSSDGIVLGLANDFNGAHLTIGTVPLMVSDGNTVSGTWFYWAHAAVTASSPATFTCSTLNDTVIVGGIAFQAGGTILMGQACL